MLRRALLATCIVAASACAAQSGNSASLAQDGDAGPIPVVPRDAPVSTIRNVPATTGRANLRQTRPPFTITPIGRFDAPFAMAFLPDGRLLVTEKAGRLKLRAVDGRVTVVTTDLRVAQGGQGGLLDVAPAPDFTTSRTVYVTYSEPGRGGSQLALARGHLREAAGAVALADTRVIWRSGRSGPGEQFGATIAFAPDGRSLFLSSGERQRFTPAQDPDQALGKILHLDLGGRAMPDNPMARAGGVRAQTWSSGHRNPYGLAFDAGGRLWEVEMGPRGGDEVNLILPGRNYGWPIVSNGDNYSGQPIPDHPSRPDLEAPKLWWNPSISPGGAMIYAGAMFPQYSGSLFIAALSDESLIRVALDGDTAIPGDQWRMGERIRDVAQAPDGSIWVLEDGEGARLLRLTPSS